MYALEIDNLSKVYRGKKGENIEAVKGMSLSLQSGEIFGFLGPNGAGKSTTIKMLMGLMAPTTGAGKIAGMSLSMHLSRSKVGYLPENPAFYDFLTSAEYLNLVGKAFGMTKEAIAEASERVLRQLDLWAARQRPIRTFSKGMVQRLGLAQALLHDPDIYILDEPMSGLDPVGRALVKEVIKDLKQKGKTVFFSTHIISDVETICDRVGIIAKGILQRVEPVHFVVSEGLTGYLIRYEDPSKRNQSELYVEKQDLQKTVMELGAQGNVICLIEPQRKSLEAFFLDVVREQN